MASRAKDREEFVSIMTQEGIPLHVAQQLMRYSATLQRIAELECSSEAADRDRVPCPKKYQSQGGCLCRNYGAYDALTATHGSIPRIAVQEANTQGRVLALCNPYSLVPVFSGDPRGAVLKLKVPSGRTNDMGREGICVP